MSAARRAQRTVEVIDQFERNPERVSSTRLTGHKTSSVLERYNIVSDGDLWDGRRAHR